MSNVIVCKFCANVRWRADETMWILSQVNCDTSFVQYDTYFSHVNCIIYCVIRQMWEKECRVSCGRFVVAFTNMIWYDDGFISVECVRTSNQLTYFLLLSVWLWHSNSIKKYKHPVKNGIDALQWTQKRIFHYKMSNLSFDGEENEHFIWFFKTQIKWITLTTTEIIQFERIEF